MATAPAAGQPPDHPQIKVVSKQNTSSIYGHATETSWASNNGINLAGESSSKV